MKVTVYIASVVDDGKQAVTVALTPRAPEWFCKGFNEQADGLNAVAEVEAVEVTLVAPRRRQAIGQGGLTFLFRSVRFGASGGVYGRACMFESEIPHVELPRYFLINPLGGEILSHSLVDLSDGRETIWGYPDSATAHRLAGWIEAETNVRRDVARLDNENLEELLRSAAAAGAEVLLVDLPYGSDSEGLSLVRGVNLLDAITAVRAIRTNSDDQDPENQEIRLPVEVFRFDPNR